jgi:glycosyltransferase involved in cell wall biosynthesis
MDSRTAKVTIVIPCYNQAHYLPDAIKSALNQTVPVEIIVVDDGSPDNVYEATMGFPINYFKQENKGLSAARNSGIRFAKTEWVLPLDSDDIIAPNMVEKCLKVKADIIGVGQETFGDYVAGHIFQPAPKYEDFLKANQINCCSMFRKAMWEDLGGYDEDMRAGYEDWDFWMRATQKGYKVKTIPEMLFYYRKHGSSMVNEATKRHKEILEYMLNKHKK